MKMGGQSELVKCTPLIRIIRVKKKERREESICVLSSDHSIKLTAVFGICISIWTSAKKERFSPDSQRIWIISSSHGGNVNWRNGHADNVALAAN